MKPMNYVLGLMLKLLSQWSMAMPAIVQYIAVQVPAKNLAPANGTLARSLLQSWLTFVGMELHAKFGPLFNPATPEEFKNATKDRLAGRLQWLDAELAGPAPCAMTIDRPRWSWLSCP